LRCAVVGDPVAHSLSPVLHRAAYATTGLSWSYDAHPVPAGGLAAFVAGLDASWRGLSVTMPLKREAAALASEATDQVALAGAANTLVLDETGVRADNTDIPGAAAALRERWSVPDELGWTATILGGGATAASTGLALADLGAGGLRLLVRDPSRAADTVAALRRHPSGPDVEVAPLHEAPVSGPVVVSTIPAAGQTDELVARCADAAVVFDVVYHPWPTPLAESVLGGRDGRVLVSGLDLLVHQAALQFELFTGLPADSALVAAMRAALP
jgi:shikimate dehydrogenase